MPFNRTSDSNTKGEAAEALAEQFLQAQGLQTRARNYRCKVGEIDLIMQHGDTLVFVEVRLRNNPRFSQAAESVTWRKQQKIIRAAQVYLMQTRLTDSVICRFDVVALATTNSGAEPDWIQNAFGS